VGAVPAPPPPAAPAAAGTRTPNRTCEILSYGVQDPDC
jgi:hypothetical protein